MLQDPYSTEVVDRVPDDTIVKVSPVPTLITSWTYHEMTIVEFKNIIHDFYNGGSFNDYLFAWGYPAVDLRYYKK